MTEVLLILIGYNKLKGFNGFSELLQRKDLYYWLNEAFIKCKNVEDTFLDENDIKLTFIIRFFAYLVTEKIITNDEYSKGLKDISNDNSVRRILLPG